MPTRTSLLAGGFAGSGLAHLVVPAVYERIVPPQLPARRTLVVGSGIAELVCAAGLLGRARWAGRAGAALLLAVWPANVQMALDARRRAKPAWWQAALWARLPLQVPMVRTALAAPRR